MSRHSSIVSTVYAPNNAFGPNTWPSFVFNATSGVSTDHECATICFLLDGPCQLFYTDVSASTCYMGRFGMQGGTTLAAPRSGPFHQLQAAYGE